MKRNEDEHLTPPDAVPALAKRRGRKPVGEKAKSAAQRMREHRLRERLALKEEKSVTLTHFRLAEDLASLWGCTRDEAIDRALSNCAFIKDNGIIPTDLAYQPDWQTTARTK